jgi:hypothetical protein
MKNASAVAVSLTANIFPIVSRCTRVDSDDKSDEKTKTEIVAVRLFDGEPAEEIVLSEVSDDVAMACLSLHHQFELKCLRDIDLNLGRAIPKDGNTFWDVLREVVDDNPLIDTVILPATFLSIYPRSLVTQTENKTLMGEEVLYFRSAEFPELFFSIDAALSGQAICMVSSDFRIKIICCETLLDDACFMSAWIEIASVQSGIVIMIPEDPGSIWGEEKESADDE